MERIRLRTKQELLDAKSKLGLATTERGQAVAAIHQSSKLTIQASVQAEAEVSRRPGGKPCRVSASVQRLIARKRRAEARIEIIDLDTRVRQLGMMMIDEEIEEMEEQWQDLEEELGQLVRMREQSRQLDELEAKAKAQQEATE